MSDYTAAEIDAVVSDDVWEALSDNWRAPKTLSLRGVPVPVERVDGKPATEHGGENINVVVKIGTQLFQKDGYYASHDCEYWDGSVTEVRPVTKTVTVYEEV